MPLTSKGEKILQHMEEEYGSEKKAKEVLFASKNAGKISGIDESAGSMSQATLPPNPVGGMPASSRQSPVATDKLPSLDQFRQQFRDYARAGLPLQKCLQMGTVWTGSNSDEVKWQQVNDSDVFKRAVADAIVAGHSHSKAIRIAIDSWKPRKGAKDQVPDQPADMGKISGIGVPMGDSIEEPNLSKTEKFMKVDVISDKQTVDRRRAFVKGARDALKLGRRNRDAIAAGLDATHSCGCEKELFTTAKYCPPNGHVR